MLRGVVIMFGKKGYVSEGLFEFPFTLKQGILLGEHFASDSQPTFFNECLSVEALGNKVYQTYSSNFRVRYTHKVHKGRDVEVVRSEK